MFQVFSVYDKKAEAYLLPFFQQAKGQAIRTFDSAVNDPDHKFHVYAEDFALFHLGSFDELTATWTLFPSPVCLVRAHEMRAAQEVPLGSSGFAVAAPDTPDAEVPDVTQRGKANGS